MSKEEQARLWRQKIRGWQRAEALELRRRPVKELEQEISYLFEAARAIPIHASEKAELERVRQTWMRIKRGSS